MLHEVGSSAGAFAILVDGRRVRTVDARGPRSALRTTKARGLPAGRHVLELVVMRGLVGVDAVVAR